MLHDKRCSALISAGAKFAALLKVYEYIGRGKPTTSTCETLVGYIFRNEDIGWAIAYTADELRDLLLNLKIDRDALLHKTERVCEIVPKNTWEARALSAVCDFEKTILLWMFDNEI